MKLLRLLPIGGFLLLSTSCQPLPGQGHQRTVAVTETAEYYRLVATYPTSSSSQVAQYMQGQLLALPSPPQYTVRVAPGRLSISFNKQIHSAAAAARIRQLGHELTAVVTTER